VWILILSTAAVLRIRDVLSRIRGVKTHWIPDPGSRILLNIKIGMKNKTNFFLAFYSFSLKKISPKNIPLGSGIRKKFITNPEPGSRG
jgi:hypothetical protein